MAYLNRNASDAVLPVRIGLIGSGWMGAFHAESIARRVPGAVLPPSRIRTWNPPRRWLAPWAPRR